MEEIAGKLNELGNGISASMLMAMDSRSMSQRWHYRSLWSGFVLSPKLGHWVAKRERRPFRHCLATVPQMVYIYSMLPRRHTETSDRYYEMKYQMTAEPNWNNASRNRAKAVTLQKKRYGWRSLEMVRVGTSLVKK